MPFSISRLLSFRETDIGQRTLARGMLTVLIWKKACSNLFITYFNIELKKNKIHFPHRHQTYGYEWSISVEGSASETPTNLSSLNVDIFQTTINSWEEMTSWGSREAWYRVIRDLPRWQITLWHFRCLRMGKIDVITYKYVIKILITMIYVDSFSY
jgi:hypothetical protein